jgi:hypothetical protein
LASEHWGVVIDFLEALLDGFAAFAVALTSPGDLRGCDFLGFGALWVIKVSTISFGSTETSKSVVFGTDLPIDGRFSFVINSLYME